MQRIPQRLIVVVLVIVATSAFVLNGDLGAESVLSLFGSILVGFGVGHEVAQARTNGRVD